MRPGLVDREVRRGAVRCAAEWRRGDDRVAFGVHQGVEYLLALLLVLIAAHVRTNSAGPVLLAALAVASLALWTDGPLGGWKVINLRNHHHLDRVFVMVLVGAPLLFHFSDFVLVLLAEGVALTLAVLVRRTAYESSPPRRLARSPSQTTRECPGASSGAPRAAGFIVGRARRDGPRALGRLVAKHCKR